MAKKEDKEEQESEAPAKSRKLSLGGLSKGPLLLVLVNFLAILGVLSLAVYTRIIYKRPAITEQHERERLEKAHAITSTPSASEMVLFEPMTVNIAPLPLNPKSADGQSQQIHGKLHYITIAFALELRDLSVKTSIEAIRPLLLDKILSILGRSQFHELTSVQGRYVLRSQILDATNQLLAGAIQKKDELGTTHAHRGSHQQPHQIALITNVFFTQFTVQ